jgi:hypothetical protein
MHATHEEVWRRTAQDDKLVPVEPKRRMSTFSINPIAIRNIIVDDPP